MGKASHKSIEVFYGAGAGDAKTKRRGINSVETGVRVLENLIALQEPSTLTAIAQASGLDNSQAHRYLSSLMNSGLVGQDPVTGHYSIGPKTLSFGLAALSRLNPIAAVSREAQRLSRDRGHTAMVSIWSPNGPIVLQWFAGRPPVYSALSVGSNLPLATSATGRVFLAFLDDNYLAPVLAAESLDETVYDPGDLQALREKTRKSCIAKVDSTLIPGLRAVAGPVFSLHNSLAAVLTLVASDAIDKSQNAAMRKDLTAACNTLTQELGGGWPG